MSAVFKTLILILMLAQVSCQSSAKKQNSSSQESWSQSMQGMSEEVRDLLPFVYSRKVNYSPKEVRRVQQQIKSFETTAHKISPQVGQRFMGKDPLMTFSLQNLSEDLSRAERALALGQIKYSKGVMKTVMGHCFRCHSVSEMGSKARWTVGSFTGLSLTPLEKSELLVASRRLDEAMDLLETSLVDAGYVQNFPFDYEASLKRYLVLVVRLSPNPERAISTFEKVLEMKSVPYFLAQKVEQWRVSLKTWSKVKKSPSPTLAAAKKLVSQAKREQGYDRDHSADVEFLRSTSMLHNLLMANRYAKQKSEIYFLLGEVYQVLDELGYWGLHESYYESCIKEKPHSLLSARCFRRLQESVFLGFSGSSGVHIPPDEMERLKGLRAMAMPHMKK